MTEDHVKILVVEDEETHAELIRRSFAKASNRYELLVTPSLKAARAIMEVFKPDLIISDLLLPDGKGTDLIEPEPQRPFIVMTSFGDEHAAVEAIKAGALDYVVKSVSSMSEMPRSVEHALREWSHIAEKARAEAALADSEERYRATFENCGNALALIESDTTITVCNREFETLTGYAKAEIEGRLSWQAFIATSEDSERMLEDHRLRRMDPNRAPNSYEFKLIDRERNTKAVLATVSLIPGSQISLAALTDISAHKRAEEVMHALEAQLTQARKLEAIGRLAGGIAHDFNNLLTVICGYAELLLEKNGQPPEGLKEILGAGKRAQDLTRQLLAFGRKQVLELQPVSLNAVIQGFDKMIRRLIGEDIEVRTDLAEDLPQVMADMTQIEQIILNLAVNARDAMPTGGCLHITTTGENLDAATAARIEGLLPGAYAVLSISDTGCGMDAATLEQIYEPFFTTKEKDKGTGLGLATVYGIVKQHGGAVVCESEPGRGTCFRVYLPKTEASQVTSESIPAPSRPSHGTETILLVEDDVAMREMVNRMLSKAGYVVLVAEDGQDALRLAREAGAIDLLLSDVVMPGLNGLQVSDAIRAIKPAVQTLFMSGYSEEVIHDRVIEAGEIQLLRKPFSTRDLLLAVRNSLEAKP